MFIINNSLGRQIASTVDFLLLDPTLCVPVGPGRLRLLGTNQLRLFSLLALEERRSGWLLKAFIIKINFIS